MKNRIILGLFIIFKINVCFAQIKDTIKVKTIDSIFIKKNLSDASKSIFFLDKNKYIKNTKVLDALTNIPHISIGNDKVLFHKGNKIELLLINGVISSIEEFRSISTEDISSVEILHSFMDPTSGDNKLALNVKTKFKPGVKGYLDFSPGVLQNFVYEGAGVSIKHKNTVISFNHSNLWNTNQGNLKQLYLSEISNSKTYRNLFQPFASLSINHNLSKNKSINIKFLYSGVKEDAEINTNNALIESNMNMDSYNINFLYDWKFGKYSFKLNSDYLMNYNKYKFYVFDLNDYSNQKFREFAISPFINRKLKNGNIGLGVIYTNRDFGSINTYNKNTTENYINQSLFNIVLNSNYVLTKDLSFIFNLRYQKYIDSFNKNDILLPYIKLQHKISDKTSVETIYRKKLYRPNIYSLSGATYKEINGSETYTDPLLKYQQSNFYEISFSHSFNKTNISIAGNYEKTKNNISSLGRIKENTLSNKIINLDLEEFGATISLSTPINKNLNLNTFYKIIHINNFFDYQVNSGNYYNYGISLNGRFINKYNFYLNSNYRNRIYDVNYYTSLKPDISFSVSRNFLKDIIFLSLEFRNILDNSSKREFSIYDPLNNEFKNTSYLNSRLILLTISYNFGKNFNVKKINNINNDLLPK